jgi:hypothetical protein
MVSTDRTASRARIRTTAPRLLTAIFTAVVVLVLGTGTAAAWSAVPSGTFKCVSTEAGFDVGLDWTVTSWQPGSTEGENPTVVVKIAVNDGPPETIATGAFTSSNGGQFGGSVVLPSGAATVSLFAYAEGPWGDGTVDRQVKSVNLTVPTLAAIGDPECLPKESPSVGEKTPTPAPEPTPEPTAEPTPTQQAQPTTPAAEQPSPEPTAEVLGRQLARTGSGTSALIAIGFALLTVGGLAYAGSRLTSRS